MAARISGASYPDLKNRVVLITGGANGIGAEMVRAFSAQGAQVFFCDLDRKKGRSMMVELDRARGLHRYTH
jgi:NAD(P)-dependent dehydrogenase (short-subunit alcohol dehydrogenase family)